MKALSSQLFFWFIIGLFIVQAVWIALTGLYPMAFDEEVWLGTIRIYADHHLPFLSGQPVGADAFGAVARDPSYLYLYLMSFPYTVLTWLTDSQTAQVLVLRFTSIGLFTWGLFLCRRLLLRTGASRAIVHIALLLFILVPIVPLLAAHINNDNLLFPLIALALLTTLKLNDSLKARQLDARVLLQLAAICLFTSVVKFVFLPIFIVIVAFVGVRLWQQYASISSIWNAFLKGFTSLSRLAKVALIGLVLLGGVLFAERYVVNIVRYHTPVPDCGQVLNYDHCKHYGPWIRDYNLEKNKGEFDQSPLTFSRHWAYGMWYRTFFAVDGPTTGFQTRAPLLLPGLSGMVFVVVGLIAIAWTARTLWRRYNSPVLWLLAAALVCYVLFLWLLQYQLYLQAGKAVAINGRYFIPLLPIFILFVVLAVNHVVQNRRLKLLVASVAVVGFAWGGGAMTYILRSNDAWYWNNSAVRTANHAVQDVFGPITPANRTNPYTFWP